MNIVFATMNSGKAAEFETIMRELGLNARLYTLDALGIQGDVEESGATFAENARIKAMFAYNRLESSGLLDAAENGEIADDKDSRVQVFEPLVIAEDSGLEIPVLRNWPGINSKRIADTDSERIGSVLNRLDEYWENRLIGANDDSDLPVAARFVCFAAVVGDGKVVFETHGEVEGVISTVPAGVEGFGYDPIFFYPPAGRTFAEMTREEKSGVSHRRRALENVCNWLKTRASEV